METPNAIEISHLGKAYLRRDGSTIQAVHDLDLAIPSGCVFGLLGPNGAGKTTTIKMICGLVQPSAGSIRIHGVDVGQRRSLAMAQIGAVLEGTRNIHWTLSARENLVYFGHLKGMWGRKLATRAERLLKEIELWDRRDDLVRTLSRGMQQKVAVACALVADPPVLLLDEPTLGLDVQAARTVKRLIVSLSKELHKTIVLTTHQLDLAQAVCDRVAIMVKGRVLAHRPVAELLGPSQQEPYQIRVAGRLPARLAQAFAALRVEEADGDTLISADIGGQHQLYQIIAQLHAFDMPLLSVARAEPNLEQVFIELVESHDREREVGS